MSGNGQPIIAVEGHSPPDKTTTKTTHQLTSSGSGSPLEDPEMEPDCAINIEPVEGPSSGIGTPREGQGCDVTITSTPADPTNIGESQLVFVRF
jgi:hypothetical protein